ncbi:MAG: TlpA disulfide reductase family protein [Gammaproteobacteria bacterium]|nr:TlpA disulfide reductase family protein [Gammaproteobacteria bacterium]
MRLYNIKVVLLSCMLLLLTSCSRSEVTLHDSNGHTISTAQLQGKWVVINYWSDWCDNCVEEMKTLNQFYHDVESNPAIMMYGVNYDHLSGRALADVMHKLNIQFPVLVEDPAELFHLALSDYLPMTFIIDPKGRVVKRMIGPTTAQSLTSTIKQLQSLT